MWVLIILWYLVGSIGGLWISRKIYKKTSVYDFVYLFTLGGIGGLITIIIGLIFLPRTN
jgi:hypothetical protein